MLEAADLGREGGEAMTMTTIREAMMTLTKSNSVRPAHITIKLLDKEKGAFRTRRRGGGGYCRRNSSRVGR